MVLRRPAAGPYNTSKGALAVGDGAVRDVLCGMIFSAPAIRMQPGTVYAPYLGPHAYVRSCESRTRVARTACVRPYGLFVPAHPPPFALYKGVAVSKTAHYVYTGRLSARLEGPSAADQRRSTNLGRSRLARVRLGMVRSWIA